MKKLTRSFGYAFKGLRYTVATQLNFRVHLGATAIVILSGYWLVIPANEWLWLIAAISLVLITELLNTAIEALTDLVSPGYHEVAGHVKDISAGAVVLTAVFALITGAIIFLPKLITLLYAA